MITELEALYASYSNQELLHIVHRPSDYAPEAVALAERILEGRAVSDEERYAVAQHYARIGADARSRREARAALREQAADFFEPLLRPGERVEPRKWLNLLLLVLGLQFAWEAYRATYGFLQLLRCPGCTIGPADFLPLLEVVYLLFAFYGLLRRRRWGWMLLFADNGFDALSSLSQSYIFLRYRFVFGGSWVSFLTPIVLRALFAAFLWRPAIAGYFGVSERQKKRTALFTVVGTLVVIGLLFLAFELRT